MRLRFYRKKKNKKQNGSTSCLQIETKVSESDLIIQAVTLVTSDK